MELCTENKGIFSQKKNENKGIFFLVFFPRELNPRKLLIPSFPWSLRLSMMTFFANGAATQIQRCTSTNSMQTQRKIHNVKQTASL
jgi:hypothetical protein